jgi:hypothetical protein
MISLQCSINVPLCSRDDEDMKALRQSMQQENSIAMERMQHKDHDGGR